MGLADGLDSRRYVVHRVFVPAQPETDAGDGGDLVQRVEIVAQPHVVGDALRGLVGGDARQDLIGRQQNVIHL